MLKSNERFTKAQLAVVSKINKAESVGTLGEKSVHATIKNYLDDNTGHHEVKVGEYIADICTGGHIIEVQTKDFERLRGKVEYYLKLGYSVEVVLPIVTDYNLNWVSKETGEVVCRRRGSAKQKPVELLAEIYSLCSKRHNMIDDIDFRVIGVETEDYRYEERKTGNRRKGGRTDRCPVRMTEEIEVKHEDPRTLLRVVNVISRSNRKFNSTDFAKDNRVSKTTAQRALIVLKWKGLVKQVGRDKAGIIYEW